MGKMKVVDVLVMVASLVFLLGMVPPTFYQSREAVLRAKCSSHLRQLMEAIREYAADYNGWYPTSREPDQSIFVGSHYKDLGILYPGYVKSLDLFTCPSSGDTMPRRTSDSHDNQPFPDNEAKQVSYAYSYNGHAPNLPWTEWAPPTTRILADRHASIDLASTSNHGLEGRNVALTDGSVKWLTEKGKLLTDPDNPNPKINTKCWWSERGGWN
jgi:hypothetical protein